MRKRRFTEEQIVQALQEWDKGAKLAALVRRQLVTEQALYPPAGKRLVAAEHPADGAHDGDGVRRTLRAPIVPLLGCRALGRHDAARASTTFASIHGLR